MARFIYYFILELVHLISNLYFTHNRWRFTCQNFCFEFVMGQPGEIISEVVSITNLRFVSSQALREGC